jgi:hypothetical protein
MTTTTTRRRRRRKTSQCHNNNNNPSAKGLYSFGGRWWELEFVPHIIFRYWCVRDLLFGENHKRYCLLSHIYIYMHIYKGAATASATTTFSISIPGGRHSLEKLIINVESNVVFLYTL